MLLSLSDHFSQIISVKREQIESISESFRDDVSIQNWNYLHDNVNDSFKDFYTKLEALVDMHAPLKKLTTREIKIRSKPWLSTEILKMIKIRNKIFARKKRQPKNVNCKRLYNLFRNRVNKEIKKSKKKYYADYFTEHVNNITKTWEGVKKIVNIKKTSIRTTQLKIGGKIIDNDKEIATHFNKFFVNVGPNTENMIPKVPNLSPSKFLKNRNQIKFVIAHVSNEEMLDIINSLENKSTGPSSIPLRMLSIIPDLIILPLAHY